MMNHVRSYYQNQNNQLQKPKSAQKIKNIIIENKNIIFKNKSKYICRTRRGWTKKRIKNMITTKKRNFKEFKKNHKNSAEMKLVLTKGNEDKMSLGKFSLKRISQI